MALSRTGESGGSLRGIACMLLAGLFLISNDSVTKWLVPFYPVGEILFLQGSAIALLVWALMRLRGENPFAISRWRVHLQRGLMYAIGSFAFVYALRYLPLAEVVAIAFAGPLFMTLLGKLYLDEKVGPHRIGAVIIGFAGVLIVIRPGSAAMHWAVLLPLVVALADALRDMVTRTLTRDETSLRIVFTTALILAAAGATTSVAGWSPVQSAHLPWFAASAACFVVAHFFLVEAFRHAEISLVAPFRYFIIVWAMLSGLLFFGEVPTAPVFAGVAVIVASGLYVGWREARVGRANITTMDH